MFRVPLEKQHIPIEYAHPNLQAAHPVVGNWSDAEIWDRQVKNPINNGYLDNYMYTMDCMIGTNTIPISP